jgi:hypothetical protein
MELSRIVDDVPLGNKSPRKKSKSKEKELVNREDKENYSSMGTFSPPHANRENMGRFTKRSRRD